MIVVYTEQGRFEFTEGEVTTREHGVLSVLGEERTGKPRQVLGQYTEGCWLGWAVGESYPKALGDAWAIGPEVLMSGDESVISYQGENYYREQKSE